MTFDVMMSYLSIAIPPSCSAGRPKSALQPPHLKVLFLGLCRIKKLASGSDIGLSAQIQNIRLDTRTDSRILAILMNDRKFKFYFSVKTFFSILDRAKCLRTPDIWWSLHKIPDILYTLDSGYPAAFLPDRDQNQISKNAKIRRWKSGAPDIRHNPSHKLINFID